MCFNTPQIDPWLYPCPDRIEIQGIRDIRGSKDWVTSQPTNTFLGMLDETHTGTYLPICHACAKMCDSFTLSQRIMCFNQIKTLFLVIIPW